MDQGNQERKSELGEVVKMKDSKILDLQFVVMDDIVFKNIPFEDRINKIFGSCGNAERIN